MAQDLFDLDTGAWFSPCREYRYALWRVWDASKPVCLFVMLNPSTAAETEDDPTIKRCQVRAVNMGFGGLWVVNLFAYRSTDRKVLRFVADPVGAQNDEMIMKVAKKVSTAICGWGTDGRLRGRDAQVVKLLRMSGVQPQALKVNEDGSPGHPLYLPYALEPVEFVI